MKFGKNGLLNFVAMETRSHVTDILVTFLLVED